MNWLTQLEQNLLARLQNALTPELATAPSIPVTLGTPSLPNLAPDRTTRAELTYQGATYNNTSTSAHALLCVARFQLDLIAASNPDGSSPESSTSLYPLLEICRNSLAGWQPELVPTDASSLSGQNQASVVMPLQIEREIYQSNLANSWGYRLEFNLKLILLTSQDCPPGPWVVTGVNRCCTTAPALTQLNFFNPDL